MKLDQLAKDHFNDVDLNEMAPGGALHFTAADVKSDAAGVLEKICGIYHKVRPFLDWATRFFLIPKKIKAVIVSFMQLMDTVCPAS